MIKLSRPLASLLKDRTHRWASLWRIVRRDGTTYRFTNHNSALIYASLLYTPAGSPNVTAKQKQEIFKDRNAEIMGVISSDAVTHGDLLAGKWRGAKVEELVVDWRYPWAEPFSITRYWVIETKYTSEMWTAQLEGLTHQLKHEVGRIIGRVCDANLGDDRCAKDLTAFTFTGTVTGLNFSKRDFNTDVSQATNYLHQGKLTWTGGANSGLSMEVMRSFGTGGRIQLWLPMPHTIDVGDTFTVIAGCDRLLKTCITKFSNVVNFRGFPYVPGTDTMLKTPDAKK